MDISGHTALPSYDGQPDTCYGCVDIGHKSGIPQKAWRRYGNIRFEPNTWAHVATKGAHNRHGTVDNRIEMVLQSATHDDVTGVSPIVET